MDECEAFVYDKLKYYKHELPEKFKGRNARRNWVNQAISDFKTRIACTYKNVFKLSEDYIDQNLRVFELVTAEVYDNMIKQRIKDIKV